MGFFYFDAGCAQGEPDQISRKRFTRADQTVTSVCRDLQQLQHLRGLASRQEIRSLQRHTFDRLMTHIVNLPPLRD